jgi:hypothetical protein
MFETVTAKNSLLYAMKEYDNPQCLSVAEFNEDYKRFKYVKRLCRRYATTGHLSERLMLNHLILLVNVFGAEAAVRLLFLKCDDATSRQVLKTFLDYLNVLPELVCGVNDHDIVTMRIAFDPHLWHILHAL